MERLPYFVSEWLRIKALSGPNVLVALRSDNTYEFLGPDAEVAGRVMNADVVWVPKIPRRFGRCIMPCAAINHWKAELAAAGYGVTLAQNLAGSYPPYYIVAKHAAVGHHLSACVPMKMSERPFRNQGGMVTAGGWMAGPDVIPGRCSKPCRRPHVDADHPCSA